MEVFMGSFGRFSLGMTAGYAIADQLSNPYGNYQLALCAAQQIPLQRRGGAQRRGG